MRYRKILERLPDQLVRVLKNIYIRIPRRIRYGKVYRHTYDFIQDSQYWSRKKLEEYQIKELKKLLQHSYQNVPYYRNVFKERRLKPKNIHDFKDLKKLPLLNKDIIRENKDALIATNYPSSSFQQSNTGGSSGTPLSFFKQRRYSSKREKAFIHSIWERVGYKPKKKKLVFTGRAVESESGIRFNPAKQNFICSTYNMDEKHLSTYFELLQDEEVKYIHGHVSSIAIFAQFIVENGLHLNLKGVMGASEKVYPFQRKLIQEAFDTRLFSHYGQTEQVVLAGECEKSKKYHINPQYGITELVAEDGGVVTDYLSTGEIVGTSFNNYAMPFIRYRTGDIGKYASNQKCGCGREYKILEEVLGRSYEYIVTKDGRKISLTGLIFGQHFESFERIKKMQLYQDKKGKIEIRIVRRPTYGDKDEAEIKNTVKKAVGNGLDITFQYCDEIPLTEEGKHQFLIQKLESAERH